MEKALVYTKVKSVFGITVDIPPDRAFPTLDTQTLYDRGTHDTELLWVGIQQDFF
jgi:hypothetical protein